MAKDGIVLNEQTLPCGCVIRQVYKSPEDKEFQIEPCCATCDYFQFILRESRSQDKPIEYKSSAELQGRDG